MWLELPPEGTGNALTSSVGRVVVPSVSTSCSIAVGPFKRHGRHTAPLNAQFDASLRTQNPEWGVRCFGTELQPVAAANGFEVADIIEMPANNLTVVFHRL